MKVPDNCHTAPGFFRDPLHNVSLPSPCSEKGSAGVGPGVAGGAPVSAPKEPGTRTGVERVSRHLGPSGSLACR